LLPRASFHAPAAYSFTALEFTLRDTPQHTPRSCQNILQEPSMMILKRLLVLAAVLLLTAAPVISQAQDTTADQQAALTAVIEAQVRAQKAPGAAVAIVYDHAVWFRGGFGVRHLETNDRVTPDTLFRIGSTTKPLTVIGLLLLVEQGKVDLDAPVITYIPEFQAGDTITVRQLVSHTAGLRDNAVLYGRTDPAALTDYIATLTAEDAVFAPPGTVLSYSNPGFDAAGLVIERVSGQPYADYMAEHVFSSLKMNRSTLYPNMAMTYPLAVGYSPTITGGARVVRPNVDNAAEYPAGFVFSSVNDLTRLALFLFNDGLMDGQRILSAELVQAMKTPTARIEALKLGYGLGLLVGEMRGQTVIAHDGAINGYSSLFWTLPEHGLAVIVLANKTGFDAQPIVNAVVDTLLDLPEAAAPTAAPELDEAALEAYTGTFEQRDTSGKRLIAITFTLVDGKLIATIPGQPRLEMIPTAPDLFDLLFDGQPTGTQAAFVRGPSGSVDYLHLGFRALARVAPSP
jgi:CubicO group peptidase (beta-lactamase class C family)